MTVTAGCFGKIAYATRADAKDARKRIMARPSYVRGDPLDCYHCKLCGHFHLGRNKRQGRTDRIRNGDWGAKFARYKELTR